MDLPRTDVYTRRPRTDIISVSQSVSGVSQAESRETQTVYARNKACAASIAGHAASQVDLFFERQLADESLSLADSVRPGAGSVHFR